MQEYYAKALHHEPDTCVVASGALAACSYDKTGVRCWKPDQGNPLCHTSPYQLPPATRCHTPLFQPASLRSADPNTVAPLNGVLLWSPRAVALMTRQGLGPWAAPALAPVGPIAPLPPHYPHLVSLTQAAAPRTRAWCASRAPKPTSGGGGPPPTTRWMRQRSSPTAAGAWRTSTVQRQCSWWMPLQTGTKRCVDEWPRWWWCRYGGRGITP